MTNTTTPGAAYASYISALRAAEVFTDPDLNAAAIGRRKAEMIRAAKAAFIAATPELPAVTQTPASVLAALAPQTADDVAKFAREREKVAALRDAGQGLEAIMSAADARRVAAILDDADVVGATDPAEAERIRELSFARLVALGTPDAVTAEAEATALAKAEAWRAVFEEGVSGDVGVASRTAVYGADEDDYSRAFSNDGQPSLNWANVNRIEALNPAQA
ncbi:hypothetical protein ACFM35_00880 [Microbacterium sp. P01]|uniref:hypothetical protein n=1 Tax=Microbacterium sp. P01 TaxID=3366261 RepID=UPI0036716085